MERSKRAKISYKVSKLGNKLWEQCAKEVEEENRPGSSSGVYAEATGTDEVQPDGINVGSMEYQPADDNAQFMMEDEEDPLDENLPYENVSDDENITYGFTDKLRSWALTHQIPHAALNGLLVLLRENTNFILPKDSRTFLKTPLKVGHEIVNVAGGQLWYQGVQKSLQYYYGREIPTGNYFDININMDGLPLHNSGKTELWPILMQVHNDKTIPVMVIGIYCGLSKPENVEGYLRPFVDEMNWILDQGIMINGKLVDIRIRAFIADTPARVFIKGVISYNGYHGCMKCKVIGVFDKEARKMVYEGVGEDRTDAEFRSGLYANSHQKRLSPLLELLDVDIVQDVVVADPLHALDLGITKLLLKGYVTGTLHPFPKWSPQDERAISDILTNINLPSEIHRKFRPLLFLPFYKGSELSSFLLYASIPILKDRISKEAFDHFCLYYVAVTIFSSKFYERHYSYAAELMKKFVEQFSSIYHSSYVTSNVHNLLHIHTDVNRFGPLPSISTYPFENRLQYIKHLIRGGSKFLEQAIGRIAELREKEKVSNRNPPTEYPFIKTQRGEEIVHVADKFQLRRGNRDGWFLTRDHTLIQFDSAIELSTPLIIRGFPLLVKQPALHYPPGADILNVYKAKSSDLSPDLISVPTTNILCKMVAASKDNGITFHFTPLVHTLT